MLFSTAYLPPVEYFQKIISAKTIAIEKYEYFVKQTYRNRCVILGPNGRQTLSIPLINTHEKTVISEKKISYVENWQQRHWRSITTAYANSPYFIYFKDELNMFYEKKIEFLLEYNTEILSALLKILKIKTEIGFTDVFEKEITNDFRNSVSPKNKLKTEMFNPYPQVFSEKYSFMPNLSIIDLLFNKGPDSVKCLI